MKNYEKTAIVFDLDGTLIDSSQKLANDTIQAFQKIGYQISQEEAGISWKELLNKYNLSWEEFNTALNDRKSWEDSLEQEEVILFPETLNILKELARKRMKLGILSLSTQEYTKTKLDYFNLLNYFSQIETVHPSKGVNKNQGAINIIQRLNPNNLEQVYFIGDRPQDVTCEKAVKERFPNIITKGIYVNRNGNKNLESYKNIKNLEEILTLI